MEVFIAMGGAVAGIFVTIVLSGVLAGLISFGLLEWGLRANVQRSITEGKIAKGLKKEFEAVGHQPLAEPITKKLAERELLPSLLGLSTHALYSLPYRQLCGQLAANVSSGLSSSEYDLPTTLMKVLAIAQPKSPDEVPTPMPWPARDAAERALRFVDALQIDLANAVSSYTTRLSTVTIVLLFVALLGPLAGRLAPFGDGAGLFVHYIGRAAALLVAIIVLIAFALGSLIIASLTFRWVDRAASAR